MYGLYLFAAVLILLLQSVNVVESPELRDLLLYIGAELEEADIPHRTRLMGLITERYIYEHKAMVDEMKVDPSPK